MSDEDNAAPHVPTEEEIVPILMDILKGSDMENTTLRIVMDMLASQFNCEKEVLKDRKDFVRRKIESYLENNWTPPIPDEKQKKSSKRKPKQNARQVVDDDDEVEEEDDEDDDGGNDEEYVSDEEVGTTKKRRKKSKTLASNGGAKMGVKGHQVALTNLEKAVVLAQPLADFLGIRVCARTKVAKKINNYVRENKLQDENDGRKIHCDDKLKALFDVDEMTFFSVNKMLTPLLTKRSEVDDKELLELCDKYDEEARIEKQRVYDEKVANGEPVGKVRGSGKASKKQKSDDGEKPKRKMPDYRLSETLSEICNLEKGTRAEVVKAIWVYIREHSLSSGGKIRPDDKLKEIADVEEMGNFEISKYITPHLTKL